MLMALHTANDLARIQRPGSAQPFGVAANAEFAPPPPGVALERAPRARLKAAKRAYVTRRVSFKEKLYLRCDGVKLEAGDVVLATVVSIGQHQRIELPSGRRAGLFPGDEIIVACGARYAADQFEAKVPETVGQCSLVAAGGIAAVQVNKHGRMKSATRIEIGSVLCDSAGRKINLRQFALAAPSSPARPRAQVIVVAGTSMNAGKTTTAASIIRGLRNAKLNVAACKLTGTGAGCDAWKYLDSGALSTLDFTDAGHASTAGLATPALEAIAATLLAASDGGADIIVAEIADGLLQAETAALLQSPLFRTLIDSIVFAAGDPMSAGAGVDLLRRWGYEPAAVSGLFTASPIGIREAGSVLNVPVVTAGFLQSEPDMANIVLRRAEFRGSFENARIA